MIAQTSRQKKVSPIFFPHFVNGYWRLSLCLGLTASTRWTIVTFYKLNPNVGQPRGLYFGFDILLAFSILLLLLFGKLVFY